MSAPFTFGKRFAEIPSQTVVSGTWFPSGTVVRLLFSVRFGAYTIQMKQETASR